MAELQWRRRWKPDLSACPWKPLSIELSANETCYFVKTKFLDDAYEFLLTDLVHFWHEKLEGNALKRRVMDLNPSIEAPMSKILDQVRHSLEKPTKETKLSLRGSDDKKFLDIESHLAGMPFFFSFKASFATDTMAKDHLTVPLMAMVGELYRQQQELFKLLTAKDRQIEDYKSQGAKVSRKNLETTPFDETAFQNSMVTSKGFEEEVKTYGEKAFTSYGQDLYREITTKRAWLHSSPVKDEPREGVGAPSIESWGNRLPPSIAANRTVSPTKSPQKSPAAGSGTSSEGNSPVKDTELLRRQALERKLELEEAKAQEKNKKKKKLKF